MSEQVFKVGSIYRQRNGVLVKIDRLADKYDGYAWCIQISGLVGPAGIRRLASGRYELDQGPEYTEYDLLPGEVDEQGNPITDKVMTRVTTELPYKPDHVSVDQICAAVASLAKRDTDTKRQPLPHFTESKPFDPFKGFTVYSGDTTEPRRAGLHSPDLEPTGHRPDFLRVTASFLRGD